jgi:hypothetical protein
MGCCSFCPDVMAPTDFSLRFFRQDCVNSNLL